MPRKVIQNRQDVHVTLRAPAPLVQRLDALISKVGDLDEFALMGTLDRSKILRVALLKGVTALEQATKGTKS